MQWVLFSLLCIQSFVDLSQTFMLIDLGVPEGNIVYTKVIGSNFYDILSFKIGSLSFLLLCMLLKKQRRG